MSIQSIPPPKDPGYKPNQEDTSDKVNALGGADAAKTGQLDNLLKKQDLGDEKIGLSKSQHTVKEVSLSNDMNSFTRRKGGGRSFRLSTMSQGNAEAETPDEE